MFALSSSLDLRFFGGKLGNTDRNVLWQTETSPLWPQMPPNAYQTFEADKEKLLNMACKLPYCTDAVRKQLFFQSLFHAQCY